VVQCTVVVAAAAAIAVVAAVVVAAAGVPILSVALATVVLKFQISNFVSLYGKPIKKSTYVSLR